MSVHLKAKLHQVWPGYLILLFSEEFRQGKQKQALWGI
jgi:hypothetical protein